MDKELTQKIGDFVDANREKIISDLFELCSIPSAAGAPEEGAPFGKYPAEALKRSCEIAERYGIETTLRSEKGYAVCTYGDGKRSIAVLAHADVVPAGEGWIRTEAFSPVEKDGWLYGRGVLDDKAGVIAGIYLQRAAKELALPIRSRLLTIVGSCEETKMHDIIAFNEENEAPDFCMVPDASFPVCFCEKGLMGVDILAGKPFESIKSISGGIMTNAVAGKAEARFEYSDRMKNALERMCAENTRLALTQEGQELVLTAVGVTAHAANPQGSTNAIFILCKELYLCPEISEQDKEILEAAATAIGDYYGEGIGIDAEHPQTGRLTSVCGLAATADGKLKLTFDIRICTASSREAVENGFEKFCKAWGWELLRCTFSEGYYIDPEGPQVKALLDTYKEITGDVSAKPYFMGGGTYARHLKNALPFGLSFKNRPEGLPAGHGKEHQPDEAFKTEDLIKAIKIYILAAVELDRVLNK